MPIMHLSQSVIVRMLSVSSCEAIANLELKAEAIRNTSRQSNHVSCHDMGLQLTYSGIILILNVEPLFQQIPGGTYMVVASRIC